MTDKLQPPFNLKASIPTQQDEARLSNFPNSSTRSRTPPGSGATSAPDAVSPSQPESESLRDSPKAKIKRTSLTFAQKSALKAHLELHLVKRDPPDHLNRTHYYFSGFTDALIASLATKDLGFSVTLPIVRNLRTSFFGALARDPSKDPAPPPPAASPSQLENRLVEIENSIEILKTEIFLLTGKKH